MTLNGVRFDQNLATHNGGAIYLSNTTVSVNITDSLFTDNGAIVTHSGAVFAEKISNVQQLRDGKWMDTEAMDNYGCDGVYDASTQKCYPFRLSSLQSPISVPLTVPVTQLTIPTTVTGMVPQTTFPTKVPLPMTVTVTQPTVPTTVTGPVPQTTVSTQVKSPLQYRYNSNDSDWSGTAADGLNTCTMSNEPRSGSIATDKFHFVGKFDTLTHEIWFAFHKA